MGVNLFRIQSKKTVRFGPKLRKNGKTHQDIKDRYAILNAGGLCRWLMRSGREPSRPFRKKSLVGRWRSSQIKSDGLLGFLFQGKHALQAVGGHRLVEVVQNSELPAAHLVSLVVA